MVSYNVHNLIHLVNDVRKYGPLDNFSTFPFETKLGSIKSLLRTGNRPLEQVANRTYESMSMSADCEINEKYPILDRVSNHAESVLSYQVIKFRNYRLDVSQRNNWFLTNNSDIVKFCYATVENGKTFVYGSSIKTKTDLYHYPIKSSYLDIYKSNCVMNNIERWQLNEIKTKLFAISINNDTDERAFFPLHYEADM